jgi:hypothetical protein
LWSGDIATPLLTLALDGSELWSSWPLAKQSHLSYPLYMGVVGLQSWSQNNGKDKNLMSLPEIEPRILSHQPHCLVPILTEQSQFIPSFIWTMELRRFTSLFDLHFPSSQIYMDGYQIHML